MKSIKNIENMEDNIMKEKYIATEIEVVYFESDDIITTSNTTDDGYYDELPDIWPED